METCKTNVAGTTGLRMQYRSALRDGRESQKADMLRDDLGVPFGDFERKETRTETRKTIVAVMKEMNNQEY